MKNEIILYQSDELPQHIEVRMDEDTVWLTLNQIAQLFNRGKSVISRHLRNIYKEGELSKEATVAKNATVQVEESKPLPIASTAFLIIDEKEQYHLGASLKDLGKKWFAFSLMDGLVNQVLNQLKTAKL